MSRRVYCQTCSDTGRRGYCAPAGCYCGHEDCYAAASYVKLRPLNIAITKPRDNRMADAWADREEGSWIDGL